MSKCPNCGSTAQPKLLFTEYNNDKLGVEIVHTYFCGCGCTYTGTSFHPYSECYETTKVIPWQIVQEKLFGKG